MYKCSCDRWKRNIDKHANVFILAYKHGIKYDGEEFEYCPWCGKELVIVHVKLLSDYAT